MSFGSYVEERNGGLMTDVVMNGVLGAAFTLATFGFIFGIVWINSLIGFGRLGSATTIAAVVTAIYLLVATWTAWRKVDPLSGLRALSDGERARRDIEDFVGGGGEAALLQSLRRESIAGYATVLIAGPKSLLEALRAWRSRVTLPAARLRVADEILAKAAGPGLESGDFADPEMVMLLVELGLLRPDLSKRAPRLVASAKGKQALGIG